MANQVASPCIADNTKVEIRDPGLSPMDVRGRYPHWFPFGSTKDALPSPTRSSLQNTSNIISPLENADRESDVKDVAGQTIDQQAPSAQQPIASAAPPKAEEDLPIPHSGSSSEYPPIPWPRPQQASSPILPLSSPAPLRPPRSQRYASNFPPWMPFSYNANTEGK